MEKEVKASACEIIIGAFLVAKTGAKNLNFGVGIMHYYLYSGYKLF